MEPLTQNGFFSQCAKHPSQNSTGICSSCLMERLSSVNSVQPNPNLNTATTSLQSCEIEEIQSKSKPNPNLNNATTSLQSCEIEEIQSKPVSPNAERIANCKDSEVRLRKTLLLLFQLDDESQNENHENSKLENEMSTSGTSKEAQFDSNSNMESKLKGKGASFRLSSILPKWRKREAINKGNNLEENKNQIENKNSFRYSFDLPRHSWDGSIGKKMACSFACLEERKGRRRRDTMSETLESSKTLETGTSARVLERSLSESGTDRERKIRRGPSRRFRNLNTNKGVNANVNVNVNASVNGDSVLNNNNLGLKTDLRKNGELGFGKRRELGFGRSRSVHYQSPAGNLDNNGLLRFYLTPLRSRSTNKGRRRNSRFFAGGLFGFF